MSWSCENCGGSMNECTCKDSDFMLSGVPEQLDEIIVLLKKMAGILEGRVKT